MLLNSSWLEGKVPFSLRLLPLFWIALMLSPNLNQWKALWVLGITHVLLYSGVAIYVNFLNGKKYHGNIPVHKSEQVYWLVIAIALHLLSTVLGLFFVNFTFSLYIFLYGVVAFGFGVVKIKLTPLPYWVWILARSVQGLGAILIYFSGLNNFSIGQTPPKILLTGIIASLLLVALYPIENRTRDRRIWTDVAILLIAGTLTIWLFTANISSQYITGILISFALGFLFIIEKYFITSQHTTRWMAWGHWVGVIALNAYAFYLFTDYSQVFQLIY